MKRKTPETSEHGAKMNRRNFIELSALAGAVATLDSCGSPDHQVIRFIPDEELVPGIATWKPSLCTLCPAGCGLLVRVMQGEAEVARKGQKGLVQMGLAKKLEGNPQHPVNRGKLCARGQAGLQLVYHPDRLRNPLKRSGARGSGEFQEISWEDALKELSARLSELHPSGDAGSLAFLTRPLRGQRRELVGRFLKAFGAPPPLEYEPMDDAVLRHANAASFGQNALPTVDLARADYVISFGADFLGTWNSPVSQSIGYGEFRQGRAGRRGKFVQVEPRMSQTGANADEWIPCRSGMEGVLALGIAHVILRDKLSRRSINARAGTIMAGWTAGLPEYSSEAVEKQTEVSTATIVRLAHEITQREVGAAIIGGAPLAHTNGLFNALAVNALESLVDAGPNEAAAISFSDVLPIQGAALAPAGATNGSFSTLKAFMSAILNARPQAPKVLMINDANPVFSAPPSVRARDAILKVPYVVSFGSFLDETSSLADLILPDHAPLESWLDDVPESGATQAVVSLAAPAVRPLHNTRAMPDVILGIAPQIGGKVTATVLWKTFDEMLRSAVVQLRSHTGSVSAKTDDEFWRSMQEQGGWWSAPAATASVVSGQRAGSPSSGFSHSPFGLGKPEFDGDASAFPFYFLPYASQAFGDGSLAHLPWLQELPDVMTSAMWSSWVEINPKTAASLKIETGDIVEVASQHGTLRTPAIVSPGIAPDVLAMPVGQGHESFGRYANGRGANPFSILAPIPEPETGSLAWAATRVKITRIGKSDGNKLVLFAGGMSHFPAVEEPR